MPPTRIRIRIRVLFHTLHLMDIYMMYDLSQLPVRFCSCPGICACACDYEDAAGGQTTGLLFAAKTFHLSHTLSPPCEFPCANWRVATPTTSTPCDSSISQVAVICAPESIHSSLPPQSASINQRRPSSISHSPLDYNDEDGDGDRCRWDELTPREPSCRLSRDLSVFPTLSLLVSQRYNPRNPSLSHHPSPVPISLFFSHKSHFYLDDNLMHLPR